MANPPEQAPDSGELSALGPYGQPQLFIETFTELLDRLQPTDSIKEAIGQYDPTIEEQLAGCLSYQGLEQVVEEATVIFDHPEQLAEESQGLLKTIMKSEVAPNEKALRRRALAWVEHLKKHLPEDGSVGTYDGNGEAA